MIKNGKNGTVCGRSLGNTRLPHLLAAKNMIKHAPTASERSTPAHGRSVARAVPNKTPQDSPGVSKSLVPNRSVFKKPADDYHITSIAPSPTSHLLLTPSFLGHDSTTESNVRLILTLTDTSRLVLFDPHGSSDGSYRKALVGG